MMRSAASYDIGDSVHILGLGILEVDWEAMNLGMCSICHWILCLIPILDFLILSQPDGMQSSCMMCSRFGMSSMSMLFVMFVQNNLLLDVGHAGCALTMIESTWKILSRVSRFSFSIDATFSAMNHTFDAILCAAAIEIANSFDLDPVNPSAVLLLIDLDMGIRR